MSLQTYNQKRSFETTPEPRGQKANSAPERALQFVIQKHEASHLHYDLRLELDGVLKSWAVPKGPSMNPCDKRLAIQTEDHPLSYATFEGEIPAGSYGAGEVIVWDRGVYMSDKTVDPKESRKKLKSGFYKGELSFVLLGEKLQGAFSLVEMTNQGKNAWLLIKKPDEYASSEDVTTYTRSVISGRTLPRDTQSLSKVSSAVDGALPKRTHVPNHMHKVKPMLAKLTDGAFNRPGWFFEVKWDGYRAIGEVDGQQVSLYSRNGISFANKYTPIIKALSSIKHSCVLDGEIIALKDGQPDFYSLQRYQDTKAPLQYVLFDLLYLDGHDVRNEPLYERKRLLRNIIPPHERLLISEHVKKEGAKFFKTVVTNGLEGMVAKDSFSTYREGARSDAWLKIKSFHEQEAVIVGFTQPRGSRKLLGALVLAAYDDGNLTYIGHSGGGFSGTELEELHQKLFKIKRKTSPLKEQVPINSPITWVRPQYVCQIKFSEWTKDGRMRHPIYNGLRVDKAPGEVTKEMPVTATTARTTIKQSEDKKINTQVAFSNLDKVFWPALGYTKGDVIHYYDRISEVLLPYLKDRPQNLNRHPNGIEGKNFFQKNMDMELPEYVETQNIWSESNQRFNHYILCNNKETLLYLANLGCIELNPWNSRIGSLNTPDYMILDLDPNGRPFADLIQVAKEVRTVLDMACEEHYPKTSGKSGLHVVIPLNARYDYDTIKNFAELLMQLVHARVPDITSLERSPKQREGKIYLDYLQNRFGQTLACAYSLRPYPGATVSTPLEWSEVRKGLDPSKFTIETIFKRLEKKGDLWKGTKGKGTDLAEAIRCLEETNVV